MDTDWMDEINRLDYVRSVTARPGKKHGTSFFVTLINNEGMIFYNTTGAEVYRKVREKHG